ncbi:MAG: glycosyltransferase family 2 protein, partial [Nocardioidaceae bacterium]
MTTRWTPRRIAAGLVRRAKRWTTQLTSASSDDSRGPTVSVVLPIYNVEEYLRECLDSIVEQDFDDFEVLVVDDGSPDGSADIAAEYAGRDSRLKIITRPNGGLGAARNTGLRSAAGE